MADRERREIDALETANVDRGHAISLWIGSFAEGVDSAGVTEPVPNHVLVEHVGAQILLGREQAELVAGNEPHQRPFARADRAIAFDHLADLALDLERIPAAMTASLVAHFRLL